MIHILIVEDEKPISNLIRMSLTKAGYNCTCAFDGEEAWNLISANPYDLILLDVMIPKIDGFSLMQYIRPLKIPVIFLTAKNMVQDRVKGLELGAEDYLAKPFEIIELLARVNVVLRRYNKTDTEINIAGLVFYLITKFSISDFMVSVEINLLDYRTLYYFKNEKYI